MDIFLSIRNRYENLIYDLRNLNENGTHSILSLLSKITK